MREANWQPISLTVPQLSGDLQPHSTYIPKINPKFTRQQIDHILPNGWTKRGRLSFATFASTHQQQWPAGATNRFPIPSLDALS